MKQEVELGDMVKDLITGYQGIVVARTEFINGCVQFSVAKKLKPGQIPDMQGEPSIDEKSLRVIKKEAVNLEEDEDEEDNGGPTKFMGRMRGY